VGEHTQTVLLGQGKISRADRYAPLPGDAEQEYEKNHKTLRRKRLVPLISIGYTPPTICWGSKFLFPSKVFCDHPRLPK
jgi:hypothetical protein